MNDDVDLIIKTLDSFKEYQSAIEEQIWDVCLYMKGGITLDEAWILSEDQRVRLFKYLTKKMENKQYPTM